MSLTISATVLGELAQKGCCPRCFWVKLKSKRLPYQAFPGIFSSIDRYVKNAAALHFQQDGRLPDWYPSVGNVVALERVPHYTKFTTTDPKTGVTLRGEPDALLRLEDGAFHILDYKTARLSTSQEGMYPRYEAQLNAYAYIAVRASFSPIAGLGLLYLEPDTDVEGDPSLLARSEKDFLLGFTPRLHPVEMKPESYVEGLLTTAADIHAQPFPPEGRPSCQDCGAVDALTRLVARQE